MHISSFLLYVQMSLAHGAVAFSTVRSGCATLRIALERAHLRLRHGKHQRCQRNRTLQTAPVRTSVRTHAPTAILSHPQDATKPAHLQANRVMPEEGLEP